MSTSARRGLAAHASYCLPQFTLMFAYAMPVALIGALTDDPALKLDNASVNAALAAGSMMRAVGKACNGVTVDAVGARPFLRVILLLAALGAACFSAAQGRGMLVCVIGLLGFCNSGGWLAAVKVIEAGFHRDAWSDCFSALATFSRLGAITARIGLSSLLVALRWRSIALISSPLVLCSWLVTTQMLLRGGASSVNHMDVNAPKLDELEVGKRGPAEPKLSRIARMLTNRGLVLQCMIVASASCLMSLENMCPLLLKDLTSLNNAQIGVLATAFPSGVLVGVVITPRIFARIGTPFGKLCFELGLQMVTLLACLATSVLASLDTGSVHPAMFLACLVLMAFGISLNYYIKPSMHCLEFGEDCATASSLFNGLGLLAAVLFQLAASHIFHRGGNWQEVMLLSAALAVPMPVCSVLLFVERSGRKPAGACPKAIGASIGQLACALASPLLFWRAAPGSKTRWSA